jgi:hypothetical protein
MLSDGVAVFRSPVAIAQSRQNPGPSAVAMIAAGVFAALALTLNLVAFFHIGDAGMTDRLVEPGGIVQAITGDMARGHAASSLLVAAIVVVFGPGATAAVIRRFGGEPGPDAAKVCVYLALAGGGFVFLASAAVDLSLVALGSAFGRAADLVSIAAFALLAWPLLKALEQVELSLAPTMEPTRAGWATTGVFIVLFLGSFFVSLAGQSVFEEQ